MRSQGYTPDRCKIWLPHDGDTNDPVFDVSYRSSFEDAGYEVEVIPNQGKGAASAWIEAESKLFPWCRFDEEKTDPGRDRKSTRPNSSHKYASHMPSSA